MADLNLVPSSTNAGKNAKNVPTLQHGFLMQVGALDYDVHCVCIKYGLMGNIIGLKVYYRKKIFELS